MNVTEQKRHEYWNHFIEQWIVDKRGGGYGVTGPKLKKVKPHIFKDNNFWFDVVSRHDGLSRTPEAMQATDKLVYDHCRSNFWGMVYQMMGQMNLLK